MTFPILLALALAAQLAEPPVRDAAWAASLQPGETAQLPAGHYSGPWKLGPRVHLVASPGAILEGGDPVLTLSSGDVLEHLAVRAEGPAIGVAAVGADGLVFRDLHVSGGERGLHLRGGSLDWTLGSVEQEALFGIWTQETSVRLTGLRVHGVTGAAIFLGHSTAVLRQLEVTDAEFGVLALSGTLEMSGCRLSRLQRDGVALVKTTGRLGDNQLVGPFSNGALTATGSRGLTLLRNQIRAAGAIGIKLINCEATLVKNDVAGARSDKQGLEGDGLFLSGSEIISSGDRISDVTGVAISVMSGHADFMRCLVKGAGQAAVSVQSEGEAHFSRCSFKAGSLELIEGSGATLKNDAPIP